MDRDVHARRAGVRRPTPAPATDPEIRGVLEPVLEEFSFVTPRDTGTPLYAVSLSYRINAYTPEGEFVDSWTFTGYGAQPASSMPGQGDGDPAAGGGHRDARRRREDRGRVPRAGDRARPDRRDRAPVPAPFSRRLSRPRFSRRPEPVRRLLAQHVERLEEAHAGRRHAARRRPGAAGSGRWRQRAAPAPARFLSSVRRGARVGDAALRRHGQLDLDAAQLHFAPPGGVHSGPSSSGAT